MLAIEKDRVNENFSLKRLQNPKITLPTSVSEKNGAFLCKFNGFYARSLGIFCNPLILTSTEWPWYNIGKKLYRGENEE